MLPAQEDRTPLLPQYETTPEPYASASGYHGLQLNGYSRNRRARSWAKKALGAILAFVLILLLRWRWHSDQGSSLPGSSHSPSVPPDEGSIEQLAHWSPVERVSEPWHASKPYRRTTHLELQTSNLFAHSFGQRHSTLWSFSGTKSAGSQGTIQVEVIQRAKEAWILNNTIKVATLRSHEGRGGIGVYSDPHPQHKRDWRYSVDVTVHATFPKAKGNFERLEVRSEVGNVHFRDLDAQVDVVDVQSRLGSIYFDGTVPNTSTITLTSDAGSILVNAPIFTTRLLSTSHVGSIHWSSVYATDLIHAQSSSGNVRTDFIYAPTAVLKSDLGTIALGTAVVQDLHVVTDAGNARVSSVVPSLFTPKKDHGSDAAQVLVRTSQGSIQAGFDDQFKQQNPGQDAGSRLASQVHSVFQSDAGSVQVRYAPSFAGTVDAKTDVGSIHLGSYPAGKKWEWSHHKGVVGEAYQGCVYPPNEEGSTTMDQGHDLLEDWPEQCKYAHVPSDSVVRSTLGSVNLSF